MKRYGNLWPAVIDPGNLLAAAEQAECGKRYQAPVLAFNINLEKHLATLHEELISKTYQPGPYKTFQIFEPKKRIISAAPISGDAGDCIRR
jgi:hypothetical protein